MKTALWQVGKIPFIRDMEWKSVKITQPLQDPAVIHLSKSSYTKIKSEAS